MFEAVDQNDIAYEKYNYVLYKKADDEESESRNESYPWHVNILSD